MDGNSNSESGWWVSEEDIKPFVEPLLAVNICILSISVLPCELTATPSH